MPISLTYQHLLHAVAIRTNALVGTQVATISATYDAANLTAANFKSADWPFNSFRDAILMAVEDFAWTIADTAGHPWRAYLTDVTIPLAAGAIMPSLSVLGKPIIGAWGAVKDLDGTVLTEQPLDVVRRIMKETWRIVPVYFYKFDGNTLLHTRPSVFVECCTFSRSEQLGVQLANGQVPLPDVLEPALVARALSLLHKDGAWANQAAVYRGYSDDAAMVIRKGLSTLPAKSLPSPSISVT